MFCISGACAIWTVKWPSTEVMWLLPFVCLSICLFVCEQHNSKSYWWIFFQFSNIVHKCLSKSWLNFGDVNVTVAYYKATLKFMGPLAWRRSALCECNSLVATTNQTIMTFTWFTHTLLDFLERPASNMQEISALVEKQLTCKYRYKYSIINTKSASWISINLVQ